MNAHGLRCSKVVGMSESRNSHHSSIHVSTNAAPSGASVVTGDAIFAFGREKVHVLFLSPITMPAHSDATISIIRQQKRTVARSLLRRDDVEYRARFFAGSKRISSHGPELVQRRNRFRCTQIDISKASGETSMHGPAP